jgi:Alpha/beta hydrolase family
MPDFILVPGAGGIATPYWHIVAAKLEDAGHRSLPVDLPGADPQAGLPDYAAMIIDAIESCAEPVVVAQSMGGFSAAMACDRVRVVGLILVNAMVPAPGETPGEWWAATGAIAARIAAAEAGGYQTDFDLETYFLHDLAPEEAAGVLANPGNEVDTAFAQRCDIERWPDVATAAVIGRDDRLFPSRFQRQVLRERVGLDATVIPGGHLLALANPDALSEALLHLINS